MTKTDEIVKYLQEMTDEELKAIVKDLVYLIDNAMHPENSKFDELTTSVCRKIGSDYSISLAQSFLVSEVFDRFLKSS